MKLFQFVSASDTPDAIKQIGADKHGRFVAGGTTLIDLMKLHVETPSTLIDINGLRLTAIEELKDGLRIGANVRNSDLAWNDLIVGRYPVLSEALLSGATPQLRNMATVGGNLMQRTRCPYFRDTVWACNKRDPGAGCSALDGFNRSHAILGTSDKCIATHPSDMCVALAALEAVVKIQGANRERSVPISEFYIPYGDDPARETVLEHGELITAVELPTADLFKHSHYLKVRDRASFEFALVSVAAAMQIENGAIHGARLALGGVATKPWRSLEAEKTLVGEKPTESAFRAAAKVVLKDAIPQKHNAFKIELAERAIVRAFSTLTQAHHAVKKSTNI